ncbi:MAG: CRISPR-associated endoribonuclease Cas6, partial [Caldisphaera sp.]
KNMRLLLKLKANGNFAYDPSINHKIQGFIYKNLEGSFFDDLHNRKGSKYFCFSNIFPYGDIKEGSEVNLIISSPVSQLIKMIENRISLDNRINIGDYSFSLVSYKKFNIKIREDRVRLENSTPIILRVKKEFIEDRNKKYEYYYWRRNMNLKIFIDQLNENLIKKYESFFGIKTEVKQLFEVYKFKEELSPVVQINGKNVKLIGSYWEFETVNLDKNVLDIIRFIIDTGFGEMNSLGFGFINLKI